MCGFEPAGPSPKAAAGLGPIGPTRTTSVGTLKLKLQTPGCPRSNTEWVQTALDLLQCGAPSPFLSSTTDSALMNPRMAPARQAHRLVWIVIVVGGAACAHFFAQERAFVRVSEPVTGRIVASERRGRASVHLVELDPSDATSVGQQVRIPAPPFLGAHVGDRVSLKVQGNTGEAKRASTWGLYPNTLLVMFGSGFLLAIALFAVWRTRHD